MHVKMPDRLPCRLSIVLHKVEAGAGKRLLHRAGNPGGKGEKLRGHSLVQLQKISEMLLRKDQKCPGLAGARSKITRKSPSS